MNRARARAKTPRMGKKVYSPMQLLEMRETMSITEIMEATGMSRAGICKSINRAKAFMAERPPSPA